MVEATGQGLPYKPPVRACTEATRDEPERTRSLPWWRCRVAALVAVWIGVAKELRSRLPVDQKTSPPRRPPQREGGGGGGALRACALVNLVAFG